MGVGGRGFAVREIAQRARPEDIPDPLVNPHSAGSPARGAAWPEWLQRSFVVAFAVAVGSFVVFLAMERWRRATFMLGMAMLALAFMRQYLPDSRIGIISVRSRVFDSLFCTLLGGGLVFLAVSVDALGS